MDYNLKHFNDKEDILKTIQELLKKEHLLDKYLKEISKLQRGNVRPQDTLRRGKLASYFTANIQQLNNFVDKNKIYLSRQTKQQLKEMVEKSDKILRENIVLQSVPPLDVIPFDHVPIRHSYSFFGGRELRWGYGFHMNPFNEDGHSVTIAEMPPQYTQSIHNHTISEYCLILDSITKGIYSPGGIREKIIPAKKMDMLHFSATTPHTLSNQSSESTRNITFKQSTGLTDWRPASHLNKVKIIRARRIRGKVKRIDNQQTKRSFRIKDRFYDYTLEIIKLERDSTYTTQHEFDQYIFVVGGNFKISHKNIRKTCKKNDFIVIDKNTEYTIQTTTRCRLYTVIY